jgi:hypothetical protein
MKRALDHSLGVGEENATPTHGLVGLHEPDTEDPHDLEEDHNVPDSMELRTPEHSGHMRRIHNKGKP